MKKLNEYKSVFKEKDISNYVTVYDNGGKTADRYTVVIEDGMGGGDVYGMSEDPSSSQGFNQYVGDISEYPKGLKHTGKVIPLKKLPSDVISAIRLRFDL